MHLFIGLSTFEVWREVPHFTTGGGRLFAKQRGAHKKAAKKRKTACVPV